MPFSRCIAAALADGLIDQDKHDRFQQTYAEFEADYRGRMPAPEAAAEAARETFRFIARDAAESRRQTFLALAARADIERRLTTHRSAPGRAVNPYKGAMALYDRLAPGRNGLSVEGQHEFWRAQAQAELDHAFSTWKRNMLGQRRNLPREANIVREVFGERTGDEAAMMLAAGWKRASEMLRQAYNRFGGHIGHLEDWGLPQRHVANLIRAAGFDAWHDFTVPMLDRARMLDRESGHPLDDVALTEALRNTYASILTNGWDDREPSGNRGRALANRRSENRFLHFKDPDSWFAYQQRFGEADPINAMLAHIDGLSRDIAHMQVMGPNPNAMLGWVKARLSKQAAIDNEPARATAANVTLDKLYSNYTRSNAAPVNPLIAHAIDDVSNVLSAAQLGSAPLVTVPSDIAMQRLTRAFNGLPQVKMLSSYLKQMNPLSDADRMLAIKMGLGAQHYGEILGQQGRFTGELYGRPWSRWINDRVMHLSGLSPMTAAGRAAFGLDFFAHVAEQSGKDFGALEPAFAAMLGRYGIDGAEWDHLRATPALDVQGAKFIRPADVMAREDLEQGHALDLASKLGDAALTETVFAIPTSGSLLARSQIHGLDHPGDLRSVVFRSAAMYRTFASTVLLSHGRRIAQLGVRPTQAGRYAASLIIGSMLAGAMALQAQEIAAGRNPRPMDNWRFLLAAFVKGGGGGLLGDFIYTGLQGSSAAGQGLATIFTGPIGGLLADLSTTLFTKNGIGAVAKEPGANAKNFPTRALEFAKRYMPGGNLWYAKLAVEREIWDQLLSMADPGWQGRSARIERWYQREFQTDYWWPHGHTAPDGPPDLSNAGGSP